MITQIDHRAQAADNGLATLGWAALSGRRSPSVASRAGRSSPKRAFRPDCCLPRLANTSRLTLDSALATHFRPDGFGQEHSEGLMANDLASAGTGKTDLERMAHYRECDTRGRVVISIKWAAA